MITRCLIFFCVSFFALIKLNAQVSTIEDKAFWQEYHEPYPVGKSVEENRVLGIAVDNESTVWIATGAGAFYKKHSETIWNPVVTGKDNGTAFAVCIEEDEDRTVWIGAWNGAYVYKKDSVFKITGTEGPVTAICNTVDGMVIGGPKGIWIYKDNVIKKMNFSVAQSIRKIIPDAKNGIWVATDVGIYHCAGEKVNHFYKTNVLLSAYIKGLAMDANQRLWTAGLGGISILYQGEKERFITQQEGCPTIYTTCVSRSPDSVMWVGTVAGVVRYSLSGTHSLLFSKRWLIDDNVNDIAFDKEGNAWIATAKGVSAIKKKVMTLADKQSYFYDVLMKRHIREPWIAGQCHLKVPGDLSSWQPEDDDNDGEFTGNYLAMESFRYAATKSDDAKEKAKKAFNFLKLLREITGGNGFFARTIVPIEWKERVHDKNETYTDRQRAEMLVENPRNKPVEVRWHVSADGKWLWKGDASSDEWCGHMLGYFFYYQLVADKEEKNNIRKHVSILVDHLIANGFNMQDVDGMHTRWSVWSPDKLNRDPEWLPDQCQNSMEILAFLKLAYYMTGNIKYQQHYIRLIEKEHYLENMANIMEQNPAWFIYFDVTMQAYLYPILLHCEKDPQLLSFYRKHADAWMEKRKGDNSPLINFLYCYATGNKVELNASVDFLKNTPLDLIDWTIDHRNREDIKLIHQPVLDELQVDKLPEPAIRSTVRWDKNPWTAVNGYPDKEREPVFWLFPYWMGRYLKMIQ